jgi:hypothetical protein
MSCLVCQISLINEAISLAKKGEPLFKKPLAQDPSEKLIAVHVAALKWHMQSRTFEMTADNCESCRNSPSLLELLKTNLPEKGGEASAWKFEKAHSILHKVRELIMFGWSRISVPRGQSTVTLTSVKQWQPAPTIKTYFCAS